MANQLSDLGVSYDSVFDELRDSITDLKREWSAGLLRSYPDRDYLLTVAQRIRKDLSADAVEINAIHQGRQLTLAAVPNNHGTDAAVSNSLCVLTVGAAKPLVQFDIFDGFLTDHEAVKRKLGSWLSVPLMVHGEAAGTICALHLEARQWTPEEEDGLADASVHITNAIEIWLETN